MKALRPYQQQAFDMFKDAEHCCINLDCGLGKTVVATAIAEYNQMPTIIIAPNRLCGQWRDELIDYGVDPADIFLASNKVENKDPDKYAADFNAWIGG